MKSPEELKIFLAAKKVSARLQRDLELEITRSWSKLCSAPNVRKPADIQSGFTFVPSPTLELGEAMGFMAATVAMEAMGF